MGAVDLGIICMACVANLQYGWTLFVNPIDAKYHWGRSAIQVAFTIFVLIETWLVPVEGYLVDRFGPKWVVIGGGILVGDRMDDEFASPSSLPILYFAAAIGGVGTGCVYGTCVGNALKWFPGRRGIAAGITASGFGAGAALTIVPISHMIASTATSRRSCSSACCRAASCSCWHGCCWCRRRRSCAAQVKAEHDAHAAIRPREVLRSPVFYVLYVMFVLIAAGGLTMAASMAPIAKDLRSTRSRSICSAITMAALAFALSLNRIFDGVGRPFFGWLSDQIGREYTMALAFLIGAAALFTLSQIGGTNPVLFVLVTALYFGVYGEIFSLFPATQGDTFGSKYAAANAGMLYTAKGAGALLVPIAAGIAKAHGYGAVFTLALTFNVIAALLALFVLKPMRARALRQVRRIRDGRVAALRR